MQNILRFFIFLTSVIFYISNLVMSYYDDPPLSHNKYLPSFEACKASQHAFFERLHLQLCLTLSEDNAIHPFHMSNIS